MLKDRKSEVIRRLHAREKLERQNARRGIEQKTEAVIEKDSGHLGCRRRREIAALENQPHDRPRETQAERDERREEHQGDFQRVFEGALLLGFFLARGGVG